LKGKGEGWETMGWKINGEEVGKGENWEGRRGGKKERGRV